MAEDGAGGGGGEQPKGSLLFRALLGLASLGAFVWVSFAAGLGDAIKDASKVYWADKISTERTHDPLTKGDWFLSVFYDPNFKDVTPVGLGHFVTINFTPATQKNDLSGTYKSVRASGIVTGYKRGDKLVLSYADPTGISYAVAVLQDISPQLPPEADHNYVGAVFIYACHLANEQRCDTYQSQYKFCRAILSKNKEPDKDAGLKGYLDKPCIAYNNDLSSKLAPEPQR